MRPMYKLPDNRKEVSTGPKKKNTRRWCRGKVGVEHDKAWQIWKSFLPYRKEKQRSPMVYACVKCGKQFNNWFPYFDGQYKKIPRPVEGSK